MRIRPTRSHRRALALCALLLTALPGCAEQSPSFTPAVTGTLGATAQILGDLTYMFR